MAAEEGSRSTLPTDFVYGVARAATDDREAARSAAIIARQVDIPTAALELRASGGPAAGGGIFIDPLTGEPITLQRARQILRAQLAGNLATTLGRESRRIEDLKIRQARSEGQVRRRTTDWDPEQVQAYFKVIDEATPGQISASNGVAFALMAARRQVPIDRLRRNLDFIVDWNSHSKQMTEQETIDLAVRWSQAMGRDIGGRDIAALGLGAGRLEDLDTNSRWLQTQIAQGRDFAEADILADAVIQNAAATMTGFNEKVVGPAFDPISDVLSWIDERETLSEDVGGPLVRGVVDPLWGGVVEVSDAFINGVYGILYGVGTVATGGQFQGGVSQGLRDAWAFATRERRFGEAIALETGAEPGTPDFALRAAASEFVFGWFNDIFVVLGWAAKARSLQRLSGVGGTLGTKGTGIAALWTDPGVPYTTMLEQSFDAHVPGRWQRAATEGAEGTRLGKSRWTLIDWLMRERNIDRMIDTPRGAYGLGPGLDSRLASYIRIYVDEVRKGVLDAETRNGVRDLMRVALGQRPRHVAGTWFRQAVDENLLGKVQGQIDDVVRQALRSEELAFGSKGALNYNQQKRLARTIDKGLRDIGLSSKRASQVARDVVKLRESDLVVPVRQVERARRAAGVRVIGKTRLETDVGASQLIPEQELLEAAGAKGRVTWYDQVYEAVEGTQRTIPTIGRLQILRDARLAFDRSSWWRNQVAERLFHPFFHRSPGSVLNIEEGQIAEQAWVNWTRAWGVFDQDDMARLRAEFIRFQTLKGPAREVEWRNFVMDTFQEAYRRIGVPEELIVRLLAQARPRYAHYHESLIRAYGVRPTVVGKELIENPILETQLLNALSLPNPIEIRRAMIDSFGSIQGIQRLSERVFGKAVRELSASQQDELLKLVRTDRAIQIQLKKGGNAIVEPMTKALKRLFVVRPAWTVRVGTDESMRATVYLGSLAERWAGIRRGGGRLSQTTRTFKVNGHDVKINVVPNSPPEPSVSNQLDATRTYASIAEIQGEAGRRLGIGPLTPKAKTYWDEYERVMTLEVAQDPLGQRILRALVGDASQGKPYTMEDALAWARGNPRRWQLAQISHMDIEDHFNVAKAHVTYLTGGNEEVARSVLEGRFNRTVARQHIPNSLPEVTGDLAAEVLGTKAGLGQRSMARIIDLLGTAPSARFNRHPTYRNIFAREAERLLSQAAESGRVFSRAELESIRHGLEHGPTAGKTHPLLLRAHEFAVKQTQDIMYTMAHRSQFAEARRYLLPFMGPFEEQFTAWSTLLWQNPRIIGRIYQTTKLAVDSGFISKDEYGEYTLSPRVYAPFAIMGDWLGGFEGTDFLPSVAGLNTFWGNTFKVPIGGAEVPLPMPGFNWGFNEFLMAVVPDSWSEQEGWRGSIYNYTFAYGDAFSMIPNNYKRMFWGLMPFESETLQATTEDVLRAAALQGLDVVTHEGPLQEGEVNYEWAKRQAREWLIYRGVVGTLMPTYPIVKFEHDEARTQYFKWVDETGSFEAADRLWQERYGNAPDSELALIGARVWARGGISIPATEEVGKLLHDPEFQRVMNQMPELAFYMIPKEVREGEVDLDVYNQQVQAGLRTLRPTGTESKTLGYGPGTFTINSTIAEHDIDEGWEEWFAEDSRFRVQLDAAFPKGIPDSADDPYYGKYQGLLAAHDDIVEEIRADHPIWARESGQTQTEDPFYEGNLHMLRTVLDTSSEFRTKTDAGRALDEYFEATEGEGGILHRMKRANIRNIDTVAARDLGIAGDYKDLLAHLKETYGDDWISVYDTFLDGRHLVDVVTSGMERSAAHTPEYQDIYADWHTRWVAAGNRIEHAIGDERFAAEQRGYLLKQELSIEADAIADRFGDPKLNPQYVWYRNTLNEMERREVKLQTAITPYVFLTSFERREILGIDTSDTVEAAWAQIARDRVQTTRAIAKDPEHEDQHWDLHNRTVEAIISVTPGMAEEVKRNRDWTYALEATLPKQWRNGTEGAAWDNLFKFSNVIRQAFHGAEFVDDVEFQKVKNVMFDYIDELKRYSPHFRAHYDLLEGLDYGPGLIDTFLDPYWYLDIGG